MKIKRAYRYELDLNNEQRTQCMKFAGVSRWAYNYGLQRMNEARAIGAETPTAFDLMKEIVRLKHSTHPWLAEVSKSVPQSALSNLRQGFKRFCSGIARFPKFKARRDRVGGFRVEATTLRANGCTVTLPRLGTIRTKHETTVEGRILYATVKERAGRWFVSITTEQDIAVSLNEGPAVGVDLGIKTLATLSDGTLFNNPKPAQREQKKMRRLQRSLARRQKGSNRRQKLKEKIVRLHYRIACVRSDTLHKLTSHLAKDHGAIGIEDLNVKGLMKNHSISRAVGDCGFWELRRQLKYKCLWYGSTLVVFDRWFPSSKKCSGCGNIKEVLDLDQRTYLCEKCGLRVGRDLNAALNLRPGGISVAGQGGEGSGPGEIRGETVPRELLTEHRRA